MLNVRLLLRINLIMPNYRKESVVSDVTRTVDDVPTMVAKLHTSALWTQNDTLYPVGYVLRLRYFQIVCGICILLMGSVACIEDPNSILGIGLGVPAGVMTVLSAGASIHSSRGFGGYKPNACPYPSLRCFGPSPVLACVLTFLWTITCVLHILLIAQALRYTDYRSTETSVLLALVEVLLSTATLAALLWVTKTDLCYDPD